MEDNFWFETGGAYVYERKGKRKGLNDLKKVLDVSFIQYIEESICCQTRDYKKEIHKVNKQLVVLTTSDLENMHKIQ